MSQGEGQAVRVLHSTSFTGPPPEAEEPSSVSRQGGKEREVKVRCLPFFFSMSYSFTLLCAKRTVVSGSDCTHILNCILEKNKQLSQGIE